MLDETIIHYSKNPSNRWVLDDYNIEFWEENRTCWDDLKVYIKIKDKKIKKWSFTWDTSIITTACASIFWESIIDMEIDEVLTLEYPYVEKLIWWAVSKRRKQAAVLWLLTTRNAIHKFVNDWKKDIFDDIIKD